VDGDLRLPESAAIMGYLCDKFSLPDAWHPSSSSSSTGQLAVQQQQRRAVYESAVHWQHLNMRLGCMKLVFHTVIGERGSGIAQCALPSTTQRSGTLHAAGLLEAGVPHCGR
jgi:glutathione S-transferase